MKRTTYPRLGHPIGHFSQRIVFQWLLKLAQRGLLWHMDDDARTVIWAQGLTDRQAQLAGLDRGRALDMCRNAGVDIHRLCLIALWRVRKDQRKANKQ